MQIADHELPEGVLLRHHRWRLERGEALPWHRHGFAEWFWIEQGCGFHEYPEGAEQVEVGSLIFLPPGSVHRLRSQDDSLVWCNVSISPELYRHYQQRYADAWQPWPWQQDSYVLDDRLRQRFLLLLDGLAPLERNPAAADRCFLNLWQLLSSTDESSATVPTWLGRALASLRSPGGLEEGVSALVQASGRCHDHVARTVKRCYGLTPSLLVRAARLDAAAVQLRTSSESILAIALDCGFDNASYFAKAFRQRYGCTPRAYRRANAAIGSPIAS